MTLTASALLGMQKRPPVRGIEQPDLIHAPAVVGKERIELVEVLEDRHLKCHESMELGRLEGAPTRSRQHGTTSRQTRLVRARACARLARIGWSALTISLMLPAQRVRPAGDR